MGAKSMQAAARGVGEEILGGFLEEGLTPDGQDLPGTEFLSADTWGHLPGTWELEGPSPTLLKHSPRHLLPPRDAGGICPARRHRPVCMPGRLALRPVHLSPLRSSGLRKEGPEPRLSWGSHTSGRAGHTELRLFSAAFICDHKRRGPIAGPSAGGWRKTLRHSHMPLQGQPRRSGRGARTPTADVWGGLCMHTGRAHPRVLILTATSGAGA